LRYLIPLGIFAILVGFFAVGLELDPKKVPSPLVGKPAPEFEGALLETPERRFSESDLRGEVSLFNVWASWCAACRTEHPFLMDLAREGTVPIYGLNYKDKRDDALQWLGKLGNPYSASIVDPEGRIGLDWGVYGVPETFVVDAAGVVRWKVIGPITPEIWRKDVQPLVEQLRRGKAG